MYRKCGQHGDVLSHPHSRKGFCPAAEVPSADSIKLPSFLGCASAAESSFPWGHALCGVAPMWSLSKVGVSQPSPLILHETTPPATVHSRVSHQFGWGFVGLHYNTDFPFTGVDPYQQLPLRTLCQCMFLQSPNCPKGVGGWQSLSYAMPCRKISFVMYVVLFLFSVVFNFS